AGAPGAPRLEESGAVALYAILFQGGLSTGFAAWRSQARPIVLLGLPGTAATAAGVAVAGRLIGLDWPLAVLIGVALSPTDPPAAYPPLPGRAATARCAGGGKRRRERCSRASPASTTRSASR